MNPVAGDSDALSRPFKDQSIIVTHPEAMSLRLVERAARVGSATVHEAAGRIGALPFSIKPISPSFRVAGPAFTVHSPPDDNLWIHRAMAVARPGEVLVVYTGGLYEAGYWGEIMSTGAKAARLGGLVIDACVRDSALLEGIGFPVFARGLSVRGTNKDSGAQGSLNRPVLIGDVVIAAGDLIVGDRDGVVAIPRQRAEEVLDLSRAREKNEEVILSRLRAGENTLQVYDLDL